MLPVPISIHSMTCPAIHPKSVDALHLIIIIICASPDNSPGVGRLDKVADSRLLDIRSVEQCVRCIAHHRPLAALLRRTAPNAAMRALWTLPGRRRTPIRAQRRRQVLRFAPAIGRRRMVKLCCNSSPLLLPSHSPFQARPILFRVKWPVLVHIVPDVPVQVVRVVTHVRY